MRPLAIFVYGTLKRGEERAPLWPRPAIKVQLATTAGRLYDLGPYPAMVEGSEMIGGELWQFAEADLEPTLAALDRIECFGVDDVDLYQRRIVTCHTQSGQAVSAYAYFLADNAWAERHARVAPDTDGICRWRRHTS